MQEDLLGPQQEVLGAEYVLCARCGAPVARDAARVVPADALDTRSEYDYLCPDCDLALADGEQDLPTTLS